MRLFTAARTSNEAAARTRGPAAPTAARHAGPASATGDADATITDATDATVTIPPPPAEDDLRWLITALLEAEAGRRSVTPLRKHLSPALFETMARRAGTRPLPRFTLGKVHQHHPHTRLLEVCATAHGSVRSWAVISRFEPRWTGWRCTELHWLLPRQAYASAVAA